MVSKNLCLLFLDESSLSIGYWMGLKSPKATPIYLLVLRAQEVGNEPFWNKKKVEKCAFIFFYFLFF